MPPSMVPVDVVDVADALPAHEHRWGSRPGRPLACVDCDTPWPGDESWPPDDVGSWCEPEWRQA